MRSFRCFGLLSILSVLALQPGRVAAQCACGSGDPWAGELQMMQQYQQEVLRYQKEVAEKQQEILKQFDEDGNGVLRGAERAKFNKYAHEVRLGKKPDPFASIRPIGQPVASPAE